MRVIAGAVGGRPLLAPPGRGTRPTSDRLKQALFNILGEAVPDADVLDLYAGSGALGIEALSRGARSATFVERDARASRVLRTNLARCGYDGGGFARVIVAEVDAAIPRLLRGPVAADTPPAAPAPMSPSGARHPGRAAPLPPRGVPQAPARSTPAWPEAPQPAGAVPRDLPPGPPAPRDVSPVHTLPRPAATPRTAPAPAAMRQPAPSAEAAPGAAAGTDPATEAAPEPAAATAPATVPAHDPASPPPFTLVLADPPYATGEAARLLDLLAAAAAPLLDPACALVAIEHALGEEMPDAKGNLRLIRRRGQGRGCVSVYALGGRPA